MSNNNTNEDNIKTDALIGMWLLLDAYDSENKFNSTEDSLLNLPKLEKGISPVANILLFKIPSYGVKITPPDWLVYLIDFCVKSSPGFAQVMYKELLVFINNSKFGGTGIPENYKITAHDFIQCFSLDFTNAEKVYLDFPVLSNPKFMEKYSNLWDEQKQETREYLESDNKCDTPEYWLEVMCKE